MRVEYVNLSFRAAARTSGVLPRYVGKTLRGALGSALKRLSCHDPEAACDQCILRERCAYSVIFEGVPPAGRQIMRKYPRIPQPFVLLVPAETATFLAEGDELAFGLRLFGPAAGLYAYAVRTVTIMLERGLGRDRVPLTLSEVTDGGEPIFGDGARVLKPPARHELVIGPEPSPHAKAVEITYLTPLRMRTNGHIPARPSLEAVLKATVRRTRVLGRFYGDGSDVPVPRAVLDASRDARILSGDLHRSDVRRFSGRQDRPMTLRAIVGKARYSWPDGQPGPQAWLAAAAILHVGKSTTFGFGRIDYRVEP